LVQEGPEVVPQLSIQDGVSLQINTPLAAGRLSARGFEVSNPKLVAQAGIEAGDVILTLNGQAVNSLGDLYTLYRQAQHTPLGDLEVHLERHGVPLTKVYRVR
jgi:S1-C subfamily serine protease